MIAAKHAVQRLAFGYARYQSNWPEQTPLAIERLRAVLSRYGIVLELPAYDLESRESAIEILKVLGVSTASLEQKCIQQISNVTLTGDRLVSQIDLWEQSIQASMARLDEIAIEVIDEIELDKFQ
ncbi:hypothetical protein HL667_08975 [Bradyrhizobium sp. 83012]|uniref:Uncharacterized protein n=1 Tax=Bradyrhizobium aeschynomenes TaxID=2734909 RepID=A0ABX2CAK1_9BRAD|nr:hypothetical protein [Bradyrhizobium aeschynomenes]NPU65123.1 hypothetical protein [Bradyrhizobium aeschynomenes]